MEYVGLVGRVILGVSLFLIFMFILWRRFRIDYGEKEVLSFGIGSGILVLVLGLGFRIWAGFFSMIIVLLLMTRKKKWDGWEMGDTIMPLLGLFSGILYWPFGFSGILGVWVLFNFRKFSWYKSGRPGLAGMMTLGIFCLILIARGLGGDDKINIAGITVDQIAGIWLLTGVLVSIYLRSRIKLLK